MVWRIILLTLDAQLFPCFPCGFDIYAYVKGWTWLTVFRVGFALSEQIIGRSLGWAMLGWALAAMHTMMIFFGALGLKWWAQNSLFSKGPKWVVDTTRRFLERMWEGWVWVDCFNTQPCSYTTNREMKSCKGGNHMQRISLPNERD